MALTLKTPCLSVNTLSMLNSFINYLSAVRGYSDVTITKYRCVLNALRQEVRVLRHCDLHELDANGCRALINSISVHRNLSARSSNLYLSVLKSYFNYLVRFGYVARNSACVVPQKKTAKLLPRFISEQTMDEIIDNHLPMDSFVSARARLVILTLYHCGIRASELVNITLPNVDIANKSLKVVGKGNKERILPFGQELADALIKYMCFRARFGFGSKHLFIDADGTQMSKHTLRSIVFEVLSKHVSRELCHPHVLRHTFATALLNNGCPLNVIQTLLGHASLSTTEIYTHVTTSQLISQYSKAFKR